MNGRIFRAFIFFTLHTKILLIDPLSSKMNPLHHENEHFRQFLNANFEN